MADEPPRIVAWTDHALVKARLLTIPQANVEDAVLSGHARRTKNTGAADWLLTAGKIAIAYDHPADGDPLTARIVTLWRSI